MGAENAPIMPTIASGYPNTWEGVAKAAKVAGAKYPDLVAAQWALESGHGKHPSGRHNYFGLKGNGTRLPTTEFVNGARVHLDADFMNFKDLGNAVQYLVDRWHRNYKSFTGVNAAANRNDAARRLVHEGYATDPKYAEKLIRLMDRYAPAAPQGVDPRGSEEEGLTGPKIKAPMKPGDTYLLINDRDEDAEAYDHTGKLLWKASALARGQGSDWRASRADTPPGLYRLGQLYADYEQDPSPTFSGERQSYGWFSFDMVELENQEAKHGRAGIMLHGGGLACGWPGAWAPRQPLHATHGCVRMHNADLRDKVLPLYRKGDVYVGVFQDPY
jgi:hypothetical protein